MKKPCSQGSCENQECEYFYNCKMILTCFPELMPEDYISIEMEKNRLLKKIQKEKRTLEYVKKHDGVELYAYNPKERMFMLMIMGERLRELQRTLYDMEKTWREEIVCRLE